jgi:hypothetical protein
MSGLEPTTRPNGRVYRPRYIRVVGWDNDDRAGTVWQVAVLGTHDVTLAREYAPQGYHCPYLINPTLGWVRLGMEHGEQTWIHDDVRGAACVIFDESDDPPAVEGGETP